MNESKLLRATQRLLTPLVRILLRHGISFGEFRELSKRVYVDVADQDFSLPERKQSISRVAVVTGIQRKEVSRLLKDAVSAVDPLDSDYNRGVRVIGGWRRDVEFLNRAGEPAALDLEGGAGTFADLVKRYSGDLPMRAVLDELLRVGAVSRDEEGRVHLTSPTAYVPRDDKDAIFNIMGRSVADLLTNLDHNIEAQDGQQRLQLTTAYNNVPASALEQFRRLSSEQSKALLARLDTWLAGYDYDSNPELPAEPGARHRTGIGIYYIEEQMQDDQS